MDPLLFSGQPLAEMLSTADRDVPVHRWQGPHGHSGWLVVDSELRQRVLASPDKFGKSPAAMAATAPSQANGWKHRLAAPLLTHMLAADHVNHRRLREPVARQLRPGTALDALQPLVHHAARHALTTFQAGNEPIDVISTLTEPIPRRVIMSLLGLPPRHAQTLGHHSRQLSEVLLTPPDDLRESSIYFAKVLAPRVLAQRFLPSRQTHLLATLAQDRSLSVFEALATVSLLVIAGQETTASFIGSAIYRLLSDYGPDALSDIRNGQLSVDDVLSNTLHEHPPLPISTLRTATADLELGGCQIRRDDLILVTLTDTQTDRESTTSPGNTQRHMAFGFGPHYCVGAQLALMEARTTLTLLADSVHSMKLAAEPVWKTGIMFQAISHLPVVSVPNGLDR